MLSGVLSGVLSGLSPVRPGAAAVRLPATSNAADHSCVIRNCGANAYCVKERGDAACVCNVGFSMTFTGCADTCALKKCGGNGTCIKNSAGVASCVCGTGFVLQADGRTCTDTCALKACGGNGTCTKNAAGVASCVCVAGFVLQPDGRTCSDACELKACGGNGTCTKNAAGVASCVCDAGFVLQPDGRTCSGTCGSCPTGAACTVAMGLVPYCACPPGYGMLHGACAQGATPSVSSTSFTFYDRTNYTVTPNTYTMRLEYNGCTSIPASVASNALSLWRVDGVPGGVGSCAALYGYSLGSCQGLRTSLLPASSGTGMSAGGSINYSPVGSYPYRSFSCVPLGPCAVRNCGANTTCQVDSAGVASCVCYPGFEPSNDGRSCRDPCSFCDGNHECVKDAEGMGSCVCKYQMLYGTCVGPASCGKCPSGATCTLIPRSASAYCLCAPGYGMTESGCVLGATPTVSSTSFTFFEQPDFVITQGTYTLRVNYDGCTNLTWWGRSYVESYTRVEGAPGGVGDCANLYAYGGLGCEGQPTPLYRMGEIGATGIVTQTFPIFLGIFFSSFRCIH
ncbi:hypothetical protein CLOP_g13220 [Closterium sp. NIES-67]|nr:hypothetical protein CLOP_g13220 [Closterium sp. NIES-67]